MLRRMIISGAMAVVVVVATALPALAWMQHTNAGTPGTVFATDSPGAEGGLCGDPYEAYKCNSAYDQIFVDRYRAYSAPYAVRQSISSTAFLYQWNGSAWRLVTSYFEGSCTGAAGNGRSYCSFGSPASDVYSKPPVYCACVPAFVVAPGYYYTVHVVVYWRNAATGALLAQATYHPTGAAADIGCAAFAVSRGRCAVGASGGIGYVWLG